MLYKNKIKVQNILKSAVALMLMLTLSLSTALSPLAKAEEAKYTWKTITSVLGTNTGSTRAIYVSPDGSKLFILERYGFPENTNLWMSADDGAAWRKIFSKQEMIEYISFSTDGSKIVLGYSGASHFYISTDGGQSWVKNQNNGVTTAILSPDGSFLAGCSVDGAGATYTTYISTDNGQTWTQKGDNNILCPLYVSNNGTLIAKNYNKIARSTDYGQTWTEIHYNFTKKGTLSVSNNGNNIFDGYRISLDGDDILGPSNAPIPAGYTIIQTSISDDGKKLFVAAGSATGGATASTTRLLTSVDGGRTWHSEDDATSYAVMAMSSDASKLFGMSINNGEFVHRVGTLPAAQPVTPGSGAGGAGTVAPSSGSTSATPGQKPGKASGRLAETGISVQLIGGLAVVAIVGGLVLRKQL